MGIRRGLEFDFLAQKERQQSVEAVERAVGVRALTEQDAVDMWIARWLRIRQSDLVRRYGCDPRRLYEIWEESRFPGSRAKAMIEFQRRHPRLLDRINSARHQRIPSRSPSPDQMTLF